MGNKKIVYQVTREYMKKNKKRTFTTLFGIMFMAMLMTCVFVGKDTAINYLEELATQSRGKWHVIVYDVKNDTYEEIKSLQGIEETSLSTELGYSYFEASKNDTKPYLQLKAYQEKNFDWMNIEVVKGRLPQKQGEIVISEATLNDGADIAIGDKLSLDCFKRYICKDKDSEENTAFPYYNLVIEPGDRLEAPHNFPYYTEETADSFYEEHESTGFVGTYEVVGFIATPNFEGKNGAAYTAITYFHDETMMAENFNMSIKYDLDNTSNLYLDIYDIIGEDNGIEVNGMVLSFTGNSQDNTINGIVNIMSVFFTTLIMLASVILIYNVFNMSFDERSRYLGMLSSVGATGKQKRSSVYYEAFSMLLVALPLGFGLGLLVVKLGMKAIKPYMEQLLGTFANVSIDKIPLEISGVGIALTLGFSILTVWISAFLPARKIGKIGPIECIRGNITKSKKSYKFNIKKAKLFGAEGMLAANSVRRQKKKTRGIIGATSVFMIILIVTVVSTKILTKMINYVMIDDGTVNDKIEYDFGISNELEDENEEQILALMSKLSADENVDYVFESYYGLFVTDVDSSVLSHEYWTANEKIMDAYGLTETEKEEVKDVYANCSLNFIAYDDEMFAKIVEATGADKSIANDKTKAPVIVVQDGELSTANMVYGEKTDGFQFYEIEEMFDRQIGEKFDMKIYSQKLEDYRKLPVTVAGYATNENLSEFLSFHSEQPWIIINMDTADKINAICQNEGYKGRISRSVYVKYNNIDCESYRELADMSMAGEVLGTEESLFVYNKRTLDVENLAGAINSVIKILLICFVILTSVICMLNLYNSIRGKITGQRKEFGILRSVGITNRQMTKMLMLENGEILIRSILISVFVSTPVIWFIKTILIKMFGYVKVVFPWEVYLLAIVIAITALLLITFVSYKTEKRDNILEDIRRESV